MPEDFKNGWERERRVHFDEIVINYDIQEVYKMYYHKPYKEPPKLSKDDYWDKNGILCDEYYNISKIKIIEK